MPASPAAAMRRTTMKTTVKFRGEEREVEFTATDEPDVNAFTVEWHFVGLDSDGHAALDLSEEEDQAIFDACAEAYLDHDPGD